MFECKSKEEAENCGMMTGLITGVAFVLPLCIYGHSSLGLLKILGISLVIVAIMVVYKRRVNGQNWEYTQHVKDEYKRIYPAKTCEKLLILREGGYAGKS